MAQVEIRVNGRDYKITCDNGQEERLQQLAAHFDNHVSQLSDEIGESQKARTDLLKWKIITVAVLGAGSPECRCRPE